MIHLHFLPSLPSHYAYPVKSQLLPCDPELLTLNFNKNLSKQPQLYQ